MSFWVALVALVLSVSAFSAVLTSSVRSKMRARKRARAAAERKRLKRLQEVCAPGFHLSALALIFHSEDQELLKRLGRGAGITEKHFTFEQLLEAGISQSGMQAICSAYGLGDDISWHWLWAAARRDNFKSERASVVLL